MEVVVMTIMQDAKMIFITLEHRYLRCFWCAISVTYLINPKVMVSDIEIPRGKNLIRDRFNDQEYLIDQSTYLYIMDLIEFYHQSIYEFPDWDKVRVQKMENGNLVDCQIPINRLVFE